jgi:flagellar biosynthesis protein FliQ
MSGLFDFTKYDTDASGAEVDAATALELRRLANLFLVAGITLALFVMRAFAEALSVTFIPRGVYVAWGLALLTGWAASLVYGVFVTFTARRWGWFALCIIPLTCVPAAAAYAWIRRQEIERAVLGDGPAPAARQRRGGRKKR